MSFIRVGHHRSQKYSYSVRVSMTMPPSRSPALGINVGPGVVDLKRWSNGTKLEIQWGVGDDFGRIALRPSPDGLRLTLTRNKAASYEVRYRNLPKQPLRDARGVLWTLPITVHPAVMCPHFDLPDGSLCIQLPREWFELAGEVAAASWGHSDIRKRA